MRFVFQRELIQDIRKYNYIRKYMNDLNMVGQLYLRGWNGFNYRLDLKIASDPIIPQEQIVRFDWRLKNSHFDGLNSRLFRPTLFGTQQRRTSYGLTNLDYLHDERISSSPSYGFLDYFDRSRVGSRLNRKFQRQQRGKYISRLIKKSKILSSFSENERRQYSDLFVEEALEKGSSKKDEDKNSVLNRGQRNFLYNPAEYQFFKMKQLNTLIPTRTIRDFKRSRLFLNFWSFVPGNTKPRLAFRYRSFLPLNYFSKVASYDYLNSRLKVNDSYFHRKVRAKPDSGISADPKQLRKIFFERPHVLFPNEYYDEKKFAYQRGLAEELKHQKLRSKQFVIKKNEPNVIKTNRNYNMHTFSKNNNRQKTQARISKSVLKALNKQSDPEVTAGLTHKSSILPVSQLPNFPFKFGKKYHSVAWFFSNLKPFYILRPTATFTVFSKLNQFSFSDFPVYTFFGWKIPSDNFSGLKYPLGLLFSSSKGITTIPVKFISFDDYYAQNHNFFYSFFDNFLKKTQFVTIPTKSARFNHVLEGGLQYYNMDFMYPMISELRIKEKLVPLNFIFENIAQLNWNNIKFDPYSAIRESSVSKGSCYFLDARIQNWFIFHNIIWNEYYHFFFNRSFKSDGSGSKFCLASFNPINGPMSYKLFISSPTLEIPHIGQYFYNFIPWLQYKFRWLLYPTSTYKRFDSFRYIHQHSNKKFYFSSLLKFYQTNLFRWQQAANVFNYNQAFSRNFLIHLFFHKYKSLVDIFSLKELFQKYKGNTGYLNEIGLKQPVASSVLEFNNLFFGVRNFSKTFKNNEDFLLPSGEPSQFFFPSFTSNDFRFFQYVVDFRRWKSLQTNYFRDWKFENYIKYLGPLLYRQDIPSLMGFFAPFEFRNQIFVSKMRNDALRFSVFFPKKLVDDENFFLSNPRFPRKLFKPRNAKNSSFPSYYAFVVNRPLVNSGPNYSYFLKQKKSRHQNKLLLKGLYSQFDKFQFDPKLNLNSALGFVESLSDKFSQSMNDFFYGSFVFSDLNSKKNRLLKDKLFWMSKTYELRQIGTSASSRLFNKTSDAKVSPYSLRKLALQLGKSYDTRVTLVPPNVNFSILKKLIISDKAASTMSKSFGELGDISKLPEIFKYVNPSIYFRFGGSKALSDRWHAGQSWLKFVVASQNVGSVPSSRFGDYDVLKEKKWTPADVFEMYRTKIDTEGIPVSFEYFLPFSTTSFASTLPSKESILPFADSLNGKTISQHFRLRKHQGYFNFGLSGIGRLPRLSRSFFHMLFSRNKLDDFRKLKIEYLRLFLMSVPLFHNSEFSMNSSFKLFWRLLFDANYATTKDSFRYNLLFNSFLNFKIFLLYDKLLHLSQIGTVVDFVNAGDSNSIILQNQYSKIKAYQRFMFFANIYSNVSQRNFQNANDLLFRFDRDFFLIEPQFKISKNYFSFIFYSMHLIFGSGVCDGLFFIINFSESFFSQGLMLGANFFAHLFKLFFSNVTVYSSINSGSLFFIDRKDVNFEQWKSKFLNGEQKFQYFNIFKPSDSLIFAYPFLGFFKNLSMAELFQVRFYYGSFRSNIHWYFYPVHYFFSLKYFLHSSLKNIFFNSIIYYSTTFLKYNSILDSFFLQRSIIDFIFNRKIFFSHKSNLDNSFFQTSSELVVILSADSDSLFLNKFLGSSFYKFFNSNSVNTFIRLNFKFFNKNVFNSFFLSRNQTSEESLFLVPYNSFFFSPKFLMPFRQFDLLNFNNFFVNNSYDFVNNSENFFDSLFHNSKLLDGSGRYTRPRGLLTTLDQIFTYREFEKYRKEHHRQRFRGITPYWIQNSLKNRFNFKGFYSSPEARYSNRLKKQYFRSALFSAMDAEHFDSIHGSGRSSKLDYLGDKRILEFILKNGAKNETLQKGVPISKFNRSLQLDKDVPFFKKQIDFFTDFSNSFSEIENDKVGEFIQTRNELLNFIGESKENEEESDALEASEVANKALSHILKVDGKYSYFKDQLDSSDFSLNNIEKTRFNKKLNEIENQKNLFVNFGDVETSEFSKFLRPEKFSIEGSKRKKLKRLLMEETLKAMKMEEIERKEMVNNNTQQEKFARVGVQSTDMATEEEELAIQHSRVTSFPQVNKSGKKYQIRHKLSSTTGLIKNPKSGKGLRITGLRPEQSLENLILEIESKKNSESYQPEEAKKRLNRLKNFVTKTNISPSLIFMRSPGYTGNFLINKRYPYHFSKMFPGFSDFFLYNVEKTDAIGQQQRKENLRHGWKKGFVTSKGLHKGRISRFFSSPSNVSNEMENLRLIQPRFYKSRTKRRFLGSLNSSVGSSYGVNHKASYKASNLSRRPEHSQEFLGHILEKRRLFKSRKPRLAKHLRDGTATPRWYVPNSVRRFIRPYNKVLMHMPYLYSKWFTQNPRLSFSVNMDLLNIFISSNYDEFNYICVQSLFLLKRKIMYNVINLKMIPRKYKILYFVQINDLEMSSVLISENLFSSFRFIFLKTLLIYFVSFSRFFKEFNFFELLDILYSYYIFYLDLLFTNKFFYVRLLINPSISKFRHDSSMSSDALFENFFYYDYAVKRVLSQIATSNSTIGGWNNPLSISGQYIPGLNFYLKQFSFNFNYQYPDFFSGRSFSPESLILNNLLRQNNKVFGNELFFGEFPVTSNYRPSWHFLPYRIFSPVSPFIEYELLQNPLFSKPIKQKRWRLPLNSLRRVYDIYPNHLHSFFSIFAPETNTIVGHDATLPIKLKSLHYMLRKDPLHRRNLEKHLSQNSSKLFKHFELFPTVLKLKQLHVLSNLNKLVNFTPLVNRRRLSIRSRLWSPIRFNFYYFFNWKTFLHRFSANDLVGYRSYKLNPLFDLYQGKVPLTLKQKALQHLIVSQVPHMELDSRRRIPVKISLKEFSLLIHYFFNYVHQNFRDKGYSVSERKISRYVIRKLYPYLPNLYLSLPRKVKLQDPKIKLLNFFVPRKKYFPGHSLAYLVLNAHKEKDKRMLLSFMWSSLLERKKKLEEANLKQIEVNFSFMLNSLKKNDCADTDMQEGTLLSFMLNSWKRKRKENVAAWFPSLVKLKEEKQRQMKKGNDLDWIPFLWTMLMGKNELDLFIMDDWKEKNIPKKLEFVFSREYFQGSQIEKSRRSKLVLSRVYKIQRKFFPSLDGPGRTLTMLDRWFFSKRPFLIYHRNSDIGQSFWNFKWLPIVFRPYKTISRIASIKQLFLLKKSKERALNPLSWLKYDLFSRVRPSFRPFLFKFGRTFMLSKFIPSKGFPSYNYFIRTHTRFDNFFDRHPYLSFGVGSFQDNTLLFGESSYKEVRRRSHMFDFSKRLGFKNSPNASTNPRFKDSNAWRQSYFANTRKRTNLAKRKKFNAHPYSSPSLFGSGVKMFSKKVTLFPKEHSALTNMQQKDLKATVTVRSPLKIFKRVKHSPTHISKNAFIQEIVRNSSKVFDTRRKKRLHFLFGNKNFSTDISEFGRRKKKAKTRRHKILKKFRLEKSRAIARHLLRGFDPSIHDSDDKKKFMAFRFPFAFKHFKERKNLLKNPEFSSDFWKRKLKKKKKYHIKLFWRRQMYVELKKILFKKSLLQFRSKDFFSAVPILQPNLVGPHYFSRGRVLDSLESLNRKIKDDFFLQKRKEVNLLSTDEIKRISWRRLRWWMNMNKKKNIIFPSIKSAAILVNKSPLFFDQNLYERVGAKVIRKRLGLFKELKFHSPHGSKKSRNEVAKQQLGQSLQIRRFQQFKLLKDKDIKDKESQAILFFKNELQDSINKNIKFTHIQRNKNLNSALFARLKRMKRKYKEPKKIIKLFKLMNLFKLTNYQQNRLKLLLNDLNFVQKKVLTGLIKDIIIDNESGYRLKAKLFSKSKVTNKKIKLRIVLSKLTTAQRKILNDLLNDINDGKKKIKKTTLLLEQEKFKRNFRNTSSRILRLGTWDKQLIRIKDSERTDSSGDFDKALERSISDINSLKHNRFNKNVKIIYPKRLFGETTRKLLSKFDILKGDKKLMFDLEQERIRNKKLRKIKQYNHILRFLDMGPHLRQISRFENIEYGVARAIRIAEIEKAKEEAEKARLAKMSKAEKAAEIEKVKKAKEDAELVTKNSRTKKKLQKKKAIRYSFELLNLGGKIKSRTFRARKDYLMLAERIEKINSDMRIIQLKALQKPLMHLLDQRQATRILGVKRGDDLRFANRGLQLRNANSVEQFRLFALAKKYRNMIPNLSKKSRLRKLFLVANENRLQLFHIFNRGIIRKDREDLKKVRDFALAGFVSRKGLFYLFDIINMIQKDKVKEIRFRSHLNNWKTRKFRFHKKMSGILDVIQSPIMDKVYKNIAMLRFKRSRKNMHSPLLSFESSLKKPSIRRTFHRMLRFKSKTGLLDSSFLKRQLARIFLHSFKQAVRTSHVNEVEDKLVKMIDKRLNRKVKPEVINIRISNILRLLKHRNYQDLKDSFRSILKVSDMEMHEVYSANRAYMEGLVGGELLLQTTKDSNKKIKLKIKRNIEIPGNLGSFKSREHGVNILGLSSFKRRSHQYKHFGLLRRSKHDPVHYFGHALGFLKPEGKQKKKSRTIFTQYSALRKKKSPRSVLYSAKSIINLGMLRLNFSRFIFVNDLFSGKKDKSFGRKGKILPKIKVGSFGPFKDVISPNAEKHNEKKPKKNFKLKQRKSLNSTLKPYLSSNYASEDKHFAHSRASNRHTVINSGFHGNRRMKKRFYPVSKTRFAVRKKFVHKFDNFYKNSVIQALISNPKRRSFLFNVFIVRPYTNFFSLVRKDGLSSLPVLRDFFFPLTEVFNAPRAMKFRAYYQPNLKLFFDFNAYKQRYNLSLLFRELSFDEDFQFFLFKRYSSTNFSTIFRLESDLEFVTDFTVFNKSDFFGFSFFKNSNVLQGFLNNSKFESFVSVAEKFFLKFNFSYLVITLIDFILIFFFSFFSLIKYTYLFDFSFFLNFFDLAGNTFVYYSPTRSLFQLFFHVSVFKEYLKFSWLFSLKFLIFTFDYYPFYFLIFSSILILRSISLRVRRFNYKSPFLAPYSQRFSDLKLNGYSGWFEDAWREVHSEALDRLQQISHSNDIRLSFEYPLDTSEVDILKKNYKMHPLQNLMDSQDDMITEEKIKKNEESKLSKTPLAFINLKGRLSKLGFLSFAIPEDEQKPSEKFQFESVSNHQHSARSRLNITLNEKVVLENEENLFQTFPRPKGFSFSLFKKALSLYLRRRISFGDFVRILPLGGRSSSYNTPYTIEDFNNDFGKLFSPTDSTFKSILNLDLKSKRMFPEDENIHFYRKPGSISLTDSLRQSFGTESDQFHYVLEFPSKFNSSYINSFSRFYALRSLNYNQSHLGFLSFPKNATLPTTFDEFLIFCSVNPNFLKQQTKHPLFSNRLEQYRNLWSLFQYVTRYDYNLFSYHGLNDVRVNSSVDLVEDQPTLFENFKFWSNRASNDALDFNIFSPHWRNPDEYGLILPELVTNIEALLSARKSDYTLSSLLLKKDGKFFHRSLGSSSSPYDLNHRFIIDSPPGRFNFMVFTILYVFHTYLFLFVFFLFLVVIFCLFFLFLYSLVNYFLIAFID